MGSGLRFLEFTPDGQVLSKKIELDTALKRKLNENLLLFFTGVTRKADSVLTEQKANINGRLSVLHEMKQIAYTALDALESGKLDTIGHLLHESWRLKKVIFNYQR
jgi:D-glycero-alpha-D-manno-heptose-7-phosphate kinase